MRVMALDVGERRIGVAVSDALGITAQGVQTLQRKNDDQAIQALKALAQRYEVGAWVIGLPKNMNNSLGFKSEETKAFADLHKNSPFPSWTKVKNGTTPTFHYRQLSPHFCGGSISLARNHWAPPRTSLFPHIQV